MASVGNKVVLGMQWGDEGKGKVIDALAGRMRWVVRCQGGANAGHTVVVDGRRTVLHLLPSGALHPGAACVIGNGVVIDPHALLQELDDLGPAGEELKTRLLISDRAHLVLPCHKLLDAAAERRKGSSKVGTTLRGIGPCYGDKIARVGLRCGKLRNLPAFEQRLADHLTLVDTQLRSWGEPGFDVAAMVGEIMPSCRAIAPFVTDTVDLLHQAVKRDESILFEGAQGIMLDIDFGTYPFVTSSNTGTGGVITGCGISHRNVGEVIGIVKAYTTRVGAGPFATELDNPLGEQLRERGGEYGATTGRPRRCGWLDLVVVGYACRLNGCDTIALTKLDVLSGQAELPICVGYELDGKRIDTVPSASDAYERVKPIYERLPGWDQPLSSCRRFEELPANAQAYICFIEAQTGVRVGWIGVGPGRDEIIVR